MNSTMTNTTGISGWEYSTFVLGSLFIISEVLPLLKSNQNGFLHAALCIVKGSKCMATVIEEKIESKLDIVL